MNPLPTAFGPPVLSARLRLRPEDFFVEELPGFEPSGAGEHLLLTVEKRGLTTAQAARLLADWAGVPEMAIGYAGLKDRHAVTRQRFSLHLPRRSAPDPATLEADALRVLSVDWHARKLPRGALAGNRFVLVLREVHGDQVAVEERLKRIADAGIPNYFGEQRFGRAGDNVDTARRMFAGHRVGREQRSLLLSAARSVLFNQVLAARVLDGSWASGTDGEVWMLDGSRSVFGPTPFDDTLRDRVARFDIHPTGMLWGEGALRSAGRARAVEEAVAAAEPELCEGLARAGLRQERRALRVRVADLAWSWRAEDVLELSFGLPPGSYATTMVDQLLGERDERGVPEL